MSVLYHVFFVLMVICQQCIAEESSQYVMTLKKNMLKSPEQLEQFEKTLKDEYNYELVKSTKVGDLRVLFWNGDEQYLDTIRNLPLVRRIVSNDVMMAEADVLDDVTIDQHISTALTIRPGQNCEEFPSPLTWGLDRIDQRHKLKYNNTMNMESTYVYGENTGKDVTTYVLYSGIDHEHPTFQGRASHGFTAPGFNTDDDKYGYGTSSASIVGGLEYGVAKDVELVAVKITWMGEAYTEDFVAGLEWILEDHLERREQLGEMPKSIIFSPFAYFNEVISQCYLELVNAGVVVISPAHRSNDDACYDMPFAYQPIIVVGGTTIDDTPMHDLAYGPCIDLYAPGTEIATAWPNWRRSLHSSTSNAASFVAGVVARYMSSRDTAPTSMEVDTWLKAEATKNMIKTADNYLSSSSFFVYSEC